MTHVLTGSRVYGKPKPDSDVDVVLRMSEEERDAFTKACCTVHDEQSVVYPDGSIAFRFGKLNVIVCTTDEALTAWQVGTLACQQEAPVERKRAVELHKMAREACGVPTPDCILAGAVGGEG